MELVNQTPLSAFAFRQFDRHGDIDCVVAIRGTFLHHQGGALSLAVEQEPFVFEDTYEGDPHTTQHLKQNDLVPLKPGTDITFLGSSYAPGGFPDRSWHCSIELGPVSKSLKVYGPRFWEPQFESPDRKLFEKEKEPALTGWILSPAEEATEVELSWKNTYGGNQIPGKAGEDAEPHPANPLGCGIVDLKHFDGTEKPPAPSIVADGVGRLRWRDKPEPAGFAPLSPWWVQRHCHAGTYDDAWLEHRHPLLPEDFDHRFWQCAPPDQIAEPWLKGGENYELINLHPDHPVAWGQLPDTMLGVHVGREDRDDWYIANLDGVHFDWREDDRVVITWRARFPLPEAGDTTLTLCPVVIEMAEDEEATNPPRSEAAV